MKSTGIIIALVLILSSYPASCAAAEATLATRAQEVSQLFNANPTGFDQIFASSFRSAVPDEKLSSILKDVFARAGKCVSIEPVKDEPGAYTFTFENKWFSTIHLAIDDHPPHLVTGFFIAPLHARSIDDVITNLKKLPGHASLFAAQMQGMDLTPISELNSDEPLAVGSAFKLYVLAQLVSEVETNHRRFDEVVHLTEEAKSLPGGFLQKWPTGSPITLHTLATLMISQSDNTAADQLITILGRSNIETMLITAGNAHQTLNQPFLTTMEMFKLKGDPANAAADRYISATTEHRREMLAESIAKMDRETIVPWTTPRHIQDIEWFASTRDLARAMQWLKFHSEKSLASDARSILAINPGLSLQKNQWDYIGYKGGSEPGVIDLTFLLHSAANDRWFTVSATWNNPAHSLKESTFEELIRQFIELIK